MRVRRVAWMGLVVAGCALLVGCPSTVLQPDGRCTPGSQQSCTCLGGPVGVQICNAEGSGFGACQCPSGPSSSASSSASSSTSSGTGACQCADPTLATPPYCGAAACATSGSTSSGGCAGHVYYAGMYPSSPSIWANLPNSGGFMSFDAGNAQCKALDIGADHVCDLTEIQAAAAAHEPLLSLVPQGTTAWMQRTTPVYVEGLSGTPCTAAMVGQVDPSASDMCSNDSGPAPCVCTLSQPGPGGNCNDWQYATHHLGDGEYYVFDQQGVPTYHFDNDTIWDPNLPGVHHHAGPDFSCGGDVRALLCCYPSCM